MSLGQRIKQIRLERGETLEEFGQAIRKRSNKDLKSNKSNVSRWERDENVPNDFTLKSIGELGNTTVDELLYHESKEVRQLRAHKAFATDLQRVSNEFDLRQRNANSVVRELKDLLNSLDETVKEIGGDA